MRNKVLAVVRGTLIQTGDVTGSISVVNQSARGFTELLADTADLLAHAAETQWREEESRRRLHDPFPLRTRWRPADERLSDHWANVARTPAGTLADLGGELDEITAFYRGLPSGRLVVLGRAGIGKTSAAVRLVLDLLDTREPGEPVPVLVNLGGWDSTGTSLRTWLVDGLVRDYPALARRGPTGKSLAAALVDARRVLPVLDGLDEIAAPIRAAVLEELNATSAPVVITSRADEYAAAVGKADVLTRAACVHLVDLALDDVIGYLPLTTRKTSEGGATAWDPVLERLRSRPHDRATAALAALLTTPLMVSLARTAYSDTSGEDPSELLDTTRFATREVLEDHLFSSFVPAAFRSGAGEPRRDVDRVLRHLSAAARHLTDTGTQDLAWWQLGTAVPARLRRLWISAIAVSEVLVVLGLSAALVAVTGTRTGPGIGDIALFAGLAALLAASARGALGEQESIGPIAPSRTRWGRPRFRGRPESTQTFLSANHVFSVGYISLSRNGTPPLGILLCALLIVLPLQWFMPQLQTPTDVRSVPTSTRLLALDRRTATLQAVAKTVFLTALTTPTIALFHTTATLVDLTLTGAVVFGMVAASWLSLRRGLATTAWGRWTMMTRPWWALTRRAPWRWIAFLEEAHARGVLRQQGAVYQFRHRKLQEHLARTHTGG
ncbi:NACHT domain-containing protein [Actinosynnema sp. NPDC020468]|uniref:NACHT domain-containing protein n=1 Tax=Actinosynnema sp. NPDC020468 TaxID=3154488 RepID=UPI0033D4DDFF